jgi:S-adenosylmethionine synthetase
MKGVEIVKKYKLFTSESVTEGHPDKLADQISDAVLDAVLKQDPFGRVAIETLVTHGQIFIAGEVTTTANVDYENIARQVASSVGYTDTNLGLDANNCDVSVNVREQSPNIACGVDDGGAGDQGMMFGYACSETKEFMPLPIVLAHKITRQLAEVRKANRSLGLRPDGKSQVTIAYVDGKPHHIDTIVVSAQHEPGMTQKDVEQIVRKYVLEPVLLEYDGYQTEEITLHVNPTGIFEIGGPAGDTGLTGRKIIVDTYGGMARHGGGCFSGKDPTKVDRSAAYMARYLAKNVVAAGLADRCEIQIAYAIGMAEPVSLMVETFGTHTIPEDELADLLLKKFDLTPRGIIEFLNLRQPIYMETARNGHFGHSEFPWEAVDTYLLQ